MKFSGIPPEPAARRTARTWIRSLVWTAALTGLASRPGLAHTDPSSPLRLHVDCGAPFNGDGSAVHPYWRITDALDAARLVRQRQIRPIVIRVAPGVCTGNFEPQPARQDNRPPELLPLVVNVPDVTLHGSGRMEYAHGLPRSMRPGSETIVRVDTPRLGTLDNTVLFVGPTVDGSSADGAVIEGLVIDNAGNAYFAMYLDRTSEVVVRDNVIQHVAFGAVNVTESSGQLTGNVVHDGTPGMVLAGGTARHPASLHVERNSVTGNYEGVAVFGNSLATERLDMGANPLQPLPRPISPAPDEVGNRIEVELDGNEISGNLIGLRLALLGGGHYPYSQSGNIRVHVHHNQFVDNSDFPFAVDSGFVFRARSEYWKNPSPDDFPEGYLGSLAAPFITHGPFDGPYRARLTAVLEKNTWRNPHATPIAPAYLTLSYIDVYDPATGEPHPDLVPHYHYLHESVLNFVDRDRLLSQPSVIRDDLRLYDPIDHFTPLNNRTFIH